MELLTHAPTLHASNAWEHSETLLCDMLVPLPLEHANLIGAGNIEAFYKL